MVLIGDVVKWWIVEIEYEVEVFKVYIVLGQVCLGEEVYGQRNFVWSVEIEYVYNV